MRPDEPSWTSHRSDVGLDAPPPWLTTTWVLERLGGSAGVEDFVRNLHCGSESWPAALDTSTGWLVEGTATRFHAESASERLILEAADDVERAICEITGKTPSALRESARGPGANPARRFAVWALRQSTSLTQSQIGARLGMSSNQVAKVLARLGKNTSTSIPAWQNAWRVRAVGSWRVSNG